MASGSAGCCGGGSRAAARLSLLLVFSMLLSLPHARVHACAQTERDVPHTRTRHSVQAVAVREWSPRSGEKMGEEARDQRSGGRRGKEVVLGETAVLQGRRGETWLHRAEQEQQRRRFPRTQQERKRTQRYQRASPALALLLPLLLPLLCIGVRTRD